MDKDDGEVGIPRLNTIMQSGNEIDVENAKEMAWSSDEEEEDTVVRVGQEQQEAGASDKKAPESGFNSSLMKVRKPRKETTMMIVNKGASVSTSGIHTSASEDSSSIFNKKKQNRARRETQMVKVVASEDRRNVEREFESDSEFDEMDVIRKVDNADAMSKFSKQESEIIVMRGGNGDEISQMPSGFGDDDDSEDGDIFAKQVYNQKNGEGLDGYDDDGEEMFHMGD